MGADGNEQTCWCSQVRVGRVGGQTDGVHRSLEINLQYVVINRRVWVKEPENI